LVINAEATKEHTLLLRMALSAEDNRAYWENFRPEISKKEIAKVAFEERWFGNKSMARIQLLLTNFRRRFDLYPQALKVLCKWQPNDVKIRKNICHWHLQLADPIYRDFTGAFLNERRMHPEPRADRDIVARWLAQRIENKWAASTINRVSNNLISSAAEAGILSPVPGVRKLQHPHVDDLSLSYMLYLLREMKFNGTILSNPYLMSVGLIEGNLAQRLRRLKDLKFSLMGGLQEFDWAYIDLMDWANHTFSIHPEANE